MEDMVQALNIQAWNLSKQSMIGPGHIHGIYFKPKQEKYHEIKHKR